MCAEQYSVSGDLTISNARTHMHLCMMLLSLSLRKGLFYTRGDALKSNYRLIKLLGVRRVRTEEWNEISFVLHAIFNLSLWI
jgi:hypothetical protein